MKPHEIEKFAQRNKEAVTCFLSDLVGYNTWWRRHADELDTVRECMDMSKITIHPDELNADHTELFDEILADTKDELGLADDS